ncbi:hypothetical protein [Geobacter grbiciae]|uniref:hypothetical protein n=1 Tax=Geobacter grbiciae TaxID=155042 RepID=UPI001C00E39B|nr:hypothetical protein [Geobacter grbiciae]MBT1074001.1 hypothetical protein [Geobacter grbiciae]
MEHDHRLVSVEEFKAYISPEAVESLLTRLMEEYLDPFAAFRPKFQLAGNLLPKGVASTGTVE